MFRCLCDTTRTQGFQCANRPKNNVVSWYFLIAAKNRAAHKKRPRPLFFGAGRQNAGRVLHSLQGKIPVFYISLGLLDRFEVFQAPAKLVIKRSQDAAGKNLAQIVFSAGPLSGLFCTIYRRPLYEKRRLLVGFNIFNTPFNNPVLPYERSKCKPKSQDTTGHRTVLQ